MTLNEIIKTAIVAAGGNGLCNSDRECGCGIEDIAPCYTVDLNECTIARGRVLGPDEHIGELGPGDTLMEPLPEGPMAA
jgi:hypothetical protein